MPAANLIGDDPVVVPNLTLEFAPSAPFDPAQLGAIKVSAGGHAVPVVALLQRKHDLGRAVFYIRRAVLLSP